MIAGYLRAVYRDAVRRAYERALDEVAGALRDGGSCLDCGASSGYLYERVRGRVGLPKSRYFGIEWTKSLVGEAVGNGLNVVCADMDRELPFKDGAFQCALSLSSLEHLLHGCGFLRECRRVLRPGGRLVVLTPNIATYFNAFLLLAGRMPSSGPHPDSNRLLKSEEVVKVSEDNLEREAESEMPQHRHLVVFSYLVLRKYLQMLGFADVRGYGFGLYPFPRRLQPALERLDPYHCHQMVFAATR